MVDTQAGGLYGVVAQPLTQDYLAAQLPMFQLKVPTFSQPILQFATNSPVNMPIPPLYPGEVIKLQQNRVVCTDNFREPAVGAVYVSNFRVIFYGNSISDPESMDDFQDSSHKVFQIKKEVQASADRPASPTLTKLRFKPFKGEPSFKSFLTGGGGEQESPKESAPIAMPTSSGRPPGRVAKSHTQRLRSGLKKMSLRRSPQHQRRQKPVPRSLPTDLADGREDQDERVVQLPDDSPADSKISSCSFSTAGSHPTTESLESMSISSASEFSATGTDDRSAVSPLGDGDSSGPIEFVAGRSIPRMDLSDSPVDMSVDRTDDYYLKSDGSTDFQQPVPKLIGKPLKPHRHKVSTIPRMKQSSQSSSERKYSSPMELLPPPVKPMRDYSKRKRADATVRSVVEPESDSDTDNEAASGANRSPQNPRVEMSRSSTLEDDSIQEEGHSRSGTLRASREGSQETLVNTSMVPSVSSVTADDDHIKTLVEREVSSKAETTPTDSSSVVSPGASSHIPMEDVPGIQEEGLPDLLQVNRSRSKSNSKHPLPTSSIGMVLNHSSSSPFKPVARNRSRSGNSQVKKKPKPLPRLSVKKVGSSELEKREALFISSLPADFKVTPVPVARDRRKERGSEADDKMNTHGSLQNGKERYDMKVIDSAACKAEVNGLLGTENENNSVLSGKASEGTRVIDPVVATESTGGIDVVDGDKPGTQIVADEEDTAAEVKGAAASNETARDSGGLPEECVEGRQVQQVGSSEQSSGESSCLSPTDFVEVDPVSAPPVRPPRRKRSTFLNKKDMISLPLTASEDTLKRNGGDDIPTCSSSSTTSCDQSPAHAASADFVIVDHQSGSKDLSSDSISSISRELDGSESAVSQEVNVEKSQDLPANLLFPESEEPLSPLVAGLRKSQVKSLTQGQLQNRGSQNSMMVNTGSTPSHPSGLFRPYSMMLSADEGFVNGGERSSDFYTTGSHFSLPRQQSSSALSGAATTWSHHHTLDYRHSVKLSPASTRYSMCMSFPLLSVHSVKKLPSVQLKEFNNMKLPEGVLIMCRNFHSMRLHIHPHNIYDADAFKELLERNFLSQKPLHDLFAFQFRAAIRHPNPNFLQNRSLPNFFRLSGERARLGLQNIMLWNVRRILAERPDLCPSYPSHVIVPSCMGDLDLIRGASLYKENRFPVLTWYNSSNGAALLRAGGTKEERGQFGTNLQTDEAMLQAISGCKLNNTGPPMTVHIFTEKPEYRLKERNAEQVKSFYYHNCKFNYDSNPPTFKNVRHSFNNLQSLLESKLPDEDYFLAMDSTQWLPRISDLLSTAFEVSQALKKDGDHVLVCYESGWDRTTQIVSLAEILIDPYYRTMDGFQVLVQKEWVWFGHPFRLRHSRIGKVKDDGPVFLQWTDCVWQIMQQCPSAFEFNEKLLIALVEHSYSGLFGTFMNNNEGDRKKIFSEKGYEHVSVSSHTISFWMWVNMVNAAERRFFNEGYDSSCYEDVLQPQWAVPCLKLWISHYCKYKPKECYMHVSPLQTQLEGLQKTLMDLEALHAEISPSVPSTEYEISRDDFQVASIQSTSSTARRNSNRPPAPPPKPSSVKQYKYESLEEFLTQEGHSIEICKQLILGQTTCQGSLYKLGAKRKNWLQRWFVLDFNFQYLAYFENQQAYSNKESPKGVIRLGEISRVFQDVKKRDHLVKHVFMVATPHRTYQMQAPSITSMYIWMALLELPSSDLKLGSS